MGDPRRLIVTIPSYWSRARGQWHPADTVYDHPTPLDGDQTLGRALRSLSCLQGPRSELVVIAAATAPELCGEVRRRVARVMARNDAAGAALWDQRSVQRVRQALVADGEQELAPLVSLDGYGAVRNASLIVACLADADAVVLLDDDEVLQDADFAGKVRHSLDRGITGLAGYYVDAAGAYLLREPEAGWDRAWGKARAMNAAFSQIIGRGPRLKPTPFAFGGNMVIARALYRQVPFDPCVPRGEDIDYVINARLAGHPFQLDNTLAITHLPPPHSQPGWRQLRQDVVRFAYERDKLAQAGLDAAQLAPYPGPYVGADLAARAAEACRLLAGEYQQAGDAEGAARATALEQEAAALSFPGAWDGYLALQARWQRLTRWLRRRRQQLAGLLDPVA